MLFKWLCRQRVLSVNPASELELPKMPKPLPRHVLSVAEVEAILRLPDLSEPLGLRDRAILEVLYATAIRRAELLHLSIFDVDRERATLLIREGKGKRDRVVPLGERALGWLEKYLAEGRPELVVHPQETQLFLSLYGAPLSLHRLGIVVRGYVERAELGKKGSCHLFRHTAATLMLENGADIRYIQALLGHVKLETTSIYTQVSIHKLREVHAATHPGAWIVPREHAASALDLAEEPSPAPSASEQAATLFSLLAAEGEEEGDEHDESEVKE